MDSAVDSGRWTVGGDSGQWAAYRGHLNSGQCLVSSYGNLFMDFYLIENFYYCIYYFFSYK
jgi:hypothetical protein